MFVMIFMKLCGSRVGLLLFCVVFVSFHKKKIDRRLRLYCLKIAICQMYKAVYTFPTINYPSDNTLNSQRPKVPFLCGEMAQIIVKLNGPEHSPKDINEKVEPLRNFQRTNDITDSIATFTLNAPFI